VRRVMRWSGREQGWGGAGMGGARREQGWGGAGIGGRGPLVLLGRRHWRRGLTVVPFPPLLEPFHQKRRVRLTPPLPLSLSVDQ